MDARGHLLDLIYETVLEPRLWVTVMERMADSFRGNSAALTRINVADGSATAELVRADPIHLQRYRDHFAPLNPFAVKASPREYMSRWVPRITTEVDYLPREELALSEYFNDFMLPAEAQGSLMIDLGADDLDVITLNINRGKRAPFGPAEFEVARSLHPHLIRAFKMGRILSATTERGNSTAAALDRLGQGVVILDAMSRIRHANRAATSLLSARNGLSVVGGRLSSIHPVIARRLEALIDTAAASDPAVRRGGSMTVPSARGGSLSITVAPLPADGLAIFTSGRCVLVTIADPIPDEDAVGAKLKELFALTAAEVRVALALLGGATPRRAAQTFDVSLNTIRTQMAGIFGKTETANQAELSRLMLRLANQP